MAERLGLHSLKIIYKWLEFKAISQLVTGIIHLVVQGLWLSLLVSSVSGGHTCSSQLTLRSMHWWTAYPCNQKKISVNRKLQCKSTHFDSSHRAVVLQRRIITISHYYQSEQPQCHTVQMCCGLDFPVLLRGSVYLPMITLTNKNQNLFLLLNFRPVYQTIYWEKTVCTNFWFLKKKMNFYKWMIK